MSPASARRSPALYLGISAGLFAWSIVAIVAAALFGAAFAAIPGYLQAKRDSHIVITTIMFNYIASAFMGYLLVNVLRAPGQMNAGDAGLSARRDRAAVSRVLKPFGDHLAGHAVQSVVLAGARRRLRRLGADLAHAARL